MEYWKRFVIFIIVCIFSVGCSASSKPTMATIPTPVNVSTITIIPAPSATPTPTTTATLNTTYLTETTQSTLTAFSTLEAIFAQNPELGDPLFPCDIEYCGLSPDGKWAVFSIWEHGGGLSIIGTENEKQWKLYAGDMSVRSNFLQVAHWSKDGSYLYVVPGDNSTGGYWEIWRDRQELIRVNLESGTWSDTNMGPAFSFSPNEQFLAFRRGQSLVLHEFQTADERKFAMPAEYTSFGSFVWSPDSKKVIFIGSVSDMMQEAPLPNGFTLFLLTVDNLDVQIILEKDERYLSPQKWETPNIISLKSLFKVVGDGLLDDNNQKYQLDLETNEVILSDS